MYRVVMHRRATAHVRQLCGIICELLLNWSSGPSTALHKLSALLLHCLMLLRTGSCYANT